MSKVKFPAGGCAQGSNLMVCLTSGMISGHSLQEGTVLWPRLFPKAGVQRPDAAYSQSSQGRCRIMKH